ncbi:hypothetical protein OFM36_29565, partial [Escherichia coli]|nr:hypothetical protein [Escherichia coli]
LIVFGFIESPYRKVDNGCVVDSVTVHNGGDSKFKPGDHVPLEDVERANKKVAKEGGKLAEFEPYPFYLTAWEEDRYIIGQANIELDSKGNIVNERVAARRKGEFITADRLE